MATKTDLDERTDDPMPNAIGTPSTQRKEATSIRMRLSGAS